MFEFIIKEEPYFIPNSPKIILDKIDSGCFKNNSDKIITLFKKYAKSFNKKLGINEINDLTFIADENDDIFPILKNIQQNLLKNIQHDIEPSLIFIYTNFYNIPTLIRYNFYVKSIKINALDERVLISGILFNKPTLVPRSLLDILETMGYVIKRYLIEHNILKSNNSQHVTDNIIIDNPHSIIIDDIISRPISDKFTQNRIIFKRND